MINEGTARAVEVAWVGVMVAAVARIVVELLVMAAMYNALYNGHC
jgi:hypothetical protein